MVMENSEASDQWETPTLHKQSREIKAEVLTD